MANQVTLTFAGDADRLAREAQRAEAATRGVGDAADDASSGMDRGSASTADMSDRLSRLGNIVDGASTAVEGISGSFQAFADLQDAGRQSMQQTERALNDVAQAQADYSQALGDGTQAVLDADQAAVDHNQALLDQKIAQDELNTAIKEHGANSDEAKQAGIDLAQAGVDVKQSAEDQAQALRDGQQSLIDAKGAQLDLNDAQHAVDPGPMQKIADLMTTFAPLMQGVIGVLGLVTAAQWLWNTALFASPITWIVAGIVVLVGAIVLIATKTRWFQEAWAFAWGVIKSTAENVWNWIKQVPGWIGSAFSSVSTAITAPFRTAFNGIANLWNRTIGSLSWTVPDWVPLIGGNTLSVPKLPTFHMGGTVQGTPGSEVLAILQAGETVSRPGQAQGGGAVQLTAGPGANAGVGALIDYLIRTGEITGVMRA